jgi:hypothetical protein
VLVNRDGSTAQQPTADLAAQIAGSDAIFGQISPLLIRTASVETSLSDQGNRLTSLEDGAYADAIPYATSAAGIAATVEGLRFKVDSADPDVAYDVYLHDAGDVATLVGRQPSVQALTAKASQSELDDLAGDVTIVSGDLDTLQETIGRPKVMPKIEDFAEITMDAQGKFVKGIDKNGASYVVFNGAILREAPPITSTDGTDHVVPNLTVTGTLIAPGVGAVVYPQIFDFAQVDLDQSGKVIEALGVLGQIYRPQNEALIPCGNMGQLRGFAAYGDSTTYGADLVDPETDRWTTLLSAMMGVPIVNRGVSGQEVEEIAARLGAIPVVSSGVSGGTLGAYPAKTALIDFDVNILAGSLTSFGRLVTVDGDVIHGRLNRSDALGYDQLLFRQLESGTTDIDIAGSVEFHAYEEGLPHRSMDVLFASGVNDENQVVDGEQTVSSVIDYVSRTFTACRGQAFYWGMLDRGINEVAGTVKGDMILEVNAWAAKHFGARFIDVRGYLSSARALADAQVIDATYTPTTDDNTAVAAGVTPPSFRANSGTVHLGPLGHKLQARMMYRHLRLFYGV